MSTIEARFGHVNVTGSDWRRLAAFYTDVFGCEFVPPERDIRSADLDAATGLSDAHLTGAHLRLPGHGDSGPTLEIFQYDALDGHPGGRVDRPGGARFGEVVSMQTKDGRRITWVYVTDPEGNIVELQAWS